jgi:hypothetical protein
MACIEPFYLFAGTVRFYLMKKFAILLVLRNPLFASIWWFERHQTALKTYCTSRFFGDRFGGKEGGCAHTTVAEEVGWLKIFLYKAAQNCELFSKPRSNLKQSKTYSSWCPLLVVLQYSHADLIWADGTFKKAAYTQPMSTYSRRYVKCRQSCIFFTHGKHKSSAILVVEYTELLFTPFYDKKYEFTSQ